MNIKKTIIYLIEWLLPSCTAIYIIMSQQFTWGTYYFWGYGVNLPAYMIACILGAIIFYPINKYIFKHNYNLITIKVNGKTFKVKDGIEIEVKS